MKLTIVISNYNYERYLSEAIDSALNQTWPDVQVLVVDDGSTDNSRSLIESYGDRLQAVYQDNAGQNAAFNRAFPEVQGDVLIYLDADDRIHPTTGTKVMDAFSAAPELTRVQWPLRVVNGVGDDTGKTNPNPDFMRSGDLRAHIVRFRNHVWPAQSGNAYSVRVLRQVLPLPADERLSSDLFLAETTALIGPIQSFQEVGGDYRIHGDNNWSGNGFDADNVRRRIELTQRSHQEVLRVCSKLSIACPTDPSVALDVAFICQRLASLRLDPALHPIPGDARYKLMARGLYAAVAHPHYSVKHKAKRLVWLLGVGLGPRRLALNFIRRFYFR